METIEIQYVATDFGELVLGSFEDTLCICDWRHRKMRHAIDARIKTALNAEFKEKDSPTITQAGKELEEYAQKTRTTFSVPLLCIGTAFQKKVWEALLQIPFGTTNTYSELSNILENPKAIRAVASANGANALSIFVPCHRIIGSDGALIGYAGGLDTKRKLLVLENSYGKEQGSLFDTSIV